METKRIIAVAVQGEMSSVTKPKEGSWQPSGADRGTYLLGVSARKETDAETALAWASAQINSTRRLVVKPLDVAVENGKARFDWEPSFAQEFAGLQPGEALVSPSIARIYERKFLFERTEEGGKQLFFLRGPRSRPARLHGISPELPPFVGRKSELDRLTELTEQITQDQGQVASIVGPAGVGKSRLVSEFKEWLQSKDVPFFQGSQPQQDQGSHQAIREIVAALSKSQRHSAAWKALEPFERNCLSVFVNPGEKLDSLDGVSEDKIRSGLRNGVRNLCQKAADSPIVLILEDFHWADEGTVELAQEILKDIEGCHLLLLVLHRTEFEPPWKRLLNFTEAPLQPFTENEMLQFLKGVLRVKTVPARLSRELMRLSMGNPLYVEELLRQLVGTSLLHVTMDENDERYVNVADTAISDLPATLHTLIASRFDRLEPSLREGLRWATIFGSAFRADEFEAFLAHTGTADVPALVGDLFESMYLSERSTFPERIHQFTHDMIFEVVKETLSPRETMRRQTTVGKFLQEYYKKNADAVIDRVAEHFLKGEPQMEAFQIALRAGQVMASAHQYDRSLYFYQAATRCLEKQTLA